MSTLAAFPTKELIVPLVANLIRCRNTKREALATDLLRLTAKVLASGEWGVSTPQRSAHC